MAIPNWKLSSIVEAASAVIAGEESYVGERGAQHLVATEGADVDAPIDAIVDRCCEIDCAVFTPNPSLLAHVREMAGGYGADGAIHNALQFCTPYQLEAVSVGRAFEADRRPVLADYRSGDAGQLRTRVPAFLEQIRRGGCAGRSR